MELINCSISVYLKRNAEEFAGKTAMIFGDFSCSWKELEEITSALSYRMLKQGLHKDSHVAIWSGNHPNWVFTFLAAQRIGAIPVALNTCYKERELTRMLTYADVDAVYYGDVFKNDRLDEVVEKIQPNLTSIRQWIPIGGKPMEIADFSESERGMSARAIVAETEETIQSEDVACMLFTSGTTADAKGVLLTYTNLVNTSAATIHAMGWNPNDRLCVMVPLFHCFGVTSTMYSTIELGATMVLIPRFRSVVAMQNVQKYHCTVLNGVPSMFLAMLRNPAFGQYDLSTLKSGIIAGSAIYPNDFKRISEQIPSLCLIPSYGMTETSPAVTFSRLTDSIETKSNNSGHVIPGVQCRIVDVETRAVKNVNEVGEIEVQGFNIMKEYYRYPEETEQAFTVDGFFRTGDRGFLDEDGNLHVQGRVREMIIRGGENISPEEIEMAIKNLSWIVDVAVFGVPAEVIQERVVACVILEKGHDLQENKIRQNLKKQLADYKIPESYVVFDEFPVTTSGKIKRNELKTMLLKRLNQS